MVGSTTASDYEQILAKELGTIFQGHQTKEEFGSNGYVYIIYVSKNLARALLELKAEVEAAKNKNNSKAAKAEQD